MFKDERGFMWFGTMSGLNKYDGYTFKVFKHEAQNINSLSDDFIVNIYEGPDNKLWIDTRNGINIYDPLTDKFDRNATTALKKLNIPPTENTSIKKDSKGNFWFLRLNDGVYKYDVSKKKTYHYTKASSVKLHSSDVTCVNEDKYGNIWFAYGDGVIEKFNLATNKVVYTFDKLKSSNASSRYSYQITVDRDGDLWIYVTESTLGVYCFNPAKAILKHFGKEEALGKLNSNLVKNIVQDNKGTIWIATDHGGINLVDKNNFSVRYLLNREDDTKSIVQNSGLVYKDDLGIMWFGTYKRGISYYHENIIKFPVYKHYGSDSNSLPYQDVNAFAEDAAGNLWIGTNGGGLIYFNRKTGKYTPYKHNSKNSNSLSNDVIVSLCFDHEQKLWIGTYFGGLDCYDGKNFTHYRHSEKDSTSISDDRIWSIKEDSNHRLWVGAFAGGLNLFDPAKKSFKHYRPFAPNSVHSHFISAIFEDKDKNIWFCSYYGIDVLMRNGRFRHYIHDPKKPDNSLLMNNVMSVSQDSRGLMWISTLEGLNIYDLKKDKFSVLTKENGLPDNAVLGILEDNNHTMWLSTPKGLSNVKVTKHKSNYTYQFVNFDEKDGLQDREFNEHAFYKTRKGELIFGGAKGFNLFLPQNITTNQSRPVLALTDFQMYNKSLNPGEQIDGHVILSKSITETKKIDLKYNEDAFSILFADINFFDPGKVDLEYKLEGFDKEWLKSDKKIRKATYTNLDPGNYIFKVRVLNSGTLNTKPLALTISIAPPFWKSEFAYLLYIIAFFGGLFYIRARGIKKIETKFALAREREESQRMHELDMMKIKFFTNVSHEFRTPLALIMAPVEKSLKLTEEPEEKRQLQMIYRNAKRLLNMVNQLLDFRKIEVQELKLHTSASEVVAFIKEMSYSFSDVADKKRINFVFDSQLDSLEMNFDQDKLERILFNLLSNAFKFTPDGGHVSVLVDKVEKDEQPYIEIKVIDTGIGIPPDKHDKIFERFFQNEVPGSMVNQGSGIGLSITKEFVRLHKGEIYVESEPDQGSYFTVLLPVDLPLTNTLAYQLNTTESEVLSQSQKNASKPHHQEKNVLKKLTVLLVEDNDDFRFYLKDNLSEHFHIVEATNGREGWQKTLALHPNLVVSDISMPEMTGIDLCQKIRNDKRTLHIPVVLLTALTGEEQQLKGLETGANDYLTKPFNFEILLSKLKNILSIQQNMRKTYQKQLDIKPANVAVESVDEGFFKNALQIIEKNIANPYFSVEELSSELYISRVTLYKRSLSLTGKSPVEFIRSIRLQHGAQLIQGGHLTISQVSYKVGFKSQKYFARAFKAEFGCLPSEYLQNNKPALETQS
jgi:signal transduction histidine kinase/ligand-binding sensor domain-containing protein/DNA-binding response OmpR family regulator